MELTLAIDKYFKLLEVMDKNYTSPIKLSDVAIRMSVYGNYIGEHLGNLKATYETERSRLYFQAINEKKSATQAQNESRSQLAKERGQIDKLELTHKNLWNTVNVIQSRLRVLSQEQTTNI